MFDNSHFPKAKKYWYMGKFYEWSQPSVHAMTHALHYGSSVFEGIRAYKTPKGAGIFRLPEHVDRFLNSASVLMMGVPYDKQQITEAIIAVMKENKLDAAYIRPLLYYSYGNLGLVPQFCPVELVISAWEWGAYLGEKSTTGVHVYILPWRRIHHSQYDMTAKLGGIYVQSTICGLMARSKGFDEAVFLNLEGNVAEGPGENIFIVKDGVLKTNHQSESILEGITRNSILEIARDLGIETSIGPITKEEFTQADEAFFSGTAVQIAPIVRITDDSQSSAQMKEFQVGNGKIGETTKKLSEAYMNAVSGKTEKYQKWVAYVNEF